MSAYYFTDLDSIFFFFFHSNKYLKTLFKDAKTSYNWEKIFANHTSDKGFVSRSDKNSQNSTIRNK